jgi:hydroxyacylglutathione hydrolase
MTQVGQVSAVQAKAAIDSGGAVLLDVRERWEYDEVHLSGALLIPLMELRDRIGEVPSDKDVYVYCHLGARSARAAEFLTDSGRANVSNINGGIAAWIDAGLPAESAALR